MFTVFKEPLFLVNLIIWILGGFFTTRWLFPSIKGHKKLSWYFIWRILVVAGYILLICVSGFMTHMEQKKRVKFEKDIIEFQRIRDNGISRDLKDIKGKLKESEYSKDSVILVLKLELEENIELIERHSISIKKELEVIDSGAKLTFDPCPLREASWEKVRPYALKLFQSSGNFLRRLAKVYYSINWFNTLLESRKITVHVDNPNKENIKKTDQGIEQILPELKKELSYLLDELNKL